MLNFYACKGAHTLFTGQRERERERKKERYEERVRKREGEREKEGERERELDYINVMFYCNDWWIVTYIVI